MIARIWHGKVRSELSDEYVRFLRARAIPDYRSVEGNRGAWVLANRGDEFTEVITLSFWDSLESIKRFAGDPVDVAKYYPEDAGYLIDFPERVRHFELWEK